MFLGANVQSMRRFQPCLGEIQKAKAQIGHGPSMILCAINLLSVEDKRVIFCSKKVCKL